MRRYGGQMAQGRTPAPEVVVALEHVSFAFDDQVVLQDVSFEIQKGRMSILLGESGSGKSVLLKLVLGLLRSDAGRIYVNGQRIDTMSERDLLRARADIGMAFQELALFDSLTVNENVGYRLYEETDTPGDGSHGHLISEYGSVRLAISCRGRRLDR